MIRSQPAYIDKLGLFLIAVSVIFISHFYYRIVCRRAAEGQGQAGPGSLSFGVSPFPSPCELLKRRDNATFSLMVVKAPPG